MRDTARVLEYWRQDFNGPGDLDLETQMNRRGVSLSQPMNGMRQVDGWMTLLAGEAFEAAYRPTWHRQGPTTPDRPSARHDALEEMANCHLTHKNETQVVVSDPQSGCSPTRWSPWHRRWPTRDSGHRIRS